MRFLSENWPQTRSSRLQQGIISLSSPYRSPTPSRRSPTRNPTACEDVASSALLSFNGILQQHACNGSLRDEKKKKLFQLQAEIRLPRDTRDKSVVLNLAQDDQIPDQISRDQNINEMILG